MLQSEKDKYLEILKNVKEAKKTKTYDDNWNEVDLNYANKMYRPFSLAIVVYKYHPIKIEKCRIMENCYSVSDGFHLAIITHSITYAKFLLNIYEEKCFQLDNHGFLLTSIVKNHNYPLLELYCKVLCKSNQQKQINSFIETNNNGTVMRSTALHEAAKLAAIECIKILLSHGADTELIDSTGKQPWEMIIVAEYHLEHFFRSIISLITLLKNTTHLPVMSSLHKQIQQFTQKNISHFKCDNRKISSKIERLLSYLNYLIETNEFSSLKHISRNKLREVRIESSSKTVFIDSHEEQFYFF